MKTTQFSKVLLAFVAMIALMCVTNVQATVYTAIASADWHQNTTWSPSGQPTNGDIAQIPAGRAVAIRAAGQYCTNTAAGAQILVGGTLNLQLDGVMLGDITVSNGGNLNGNYNGARWTYAGNVTNNGTITFSGG